MANPQIGWSVEAKLLNSILKKLDQLTKVVSAGVTYPTTTTTTTAT
jgi:hypothetical protein